MNIFIDKITDGKLIITGQDVDHLRVRRHKPGNFLKLVEKQGDKYVDAELVRLDKKEAEFKINKLFTKTIKKNKITLYQAVIKKSNMELVVQKAVELGVDRIVPVLTERVAEKGKLNLARLKLIAKEAAMQSERLEIPEITEIISFKEAIKSKGLFCLGERTTGKNIKEFMSVVASSDNISVLIGPEGGFSGVEFRMMESENIPIVSFGDSIMRAETASIAALSIIRCFCLAE